MLNSWIMKGKPLAFVDCIPGWLRARSGIAQQLYLQTFNLTSLSIKRLLHLARPFLRGQGSGREGALKSPLVKMQLLQVQVKLELGKRPSGGFTLSLKCHHAVD